MNGCRHDLAERETACADGMCPICANAQIAAEREAGVKVLMERSFELHELMEQLAAEREKLREERAKFHGDDYANMDVARNRILDLEQQLAAALEALKAVRKL